MSEEVAALGSVFLPAAVITSCNNCRYNYNYNGYSTNEHATCSWVPDFQTFVQTLVDSVEGLKLSDFASSKRSHK